MALTVGTAVVFQNYSTFATSDVINLTTDAGVGDIRIVAAVALPNGTTPAVDSFSLDLPSGWTEIGIGTNSSAASDQYIRVFYRAFVGGDANTLTINFTGGDLAITSICVTVFGADLTTPLDVAVPAFIRPNANAQVASPAITPVTNGAMVFHAMVMDATSTANSGDIPSGDTNIEVNGSSTPSNGHSFGMAQRIVDPAVEVVQSNWGSLSEENVGITFAIRPAQPTYEQEGYRFREDDGSESGATWDGAQDTNVSEDKAVNKRLRILTDSTDNDPETEQVTLQYKRTDEGASEWRDI